MKRYAAVFVVVTLLIVVVPASWAQSGGMGGMKGMEGKDMGMKSMEMKNAPGNPKSGDEKNQGPHHGRGVVKEIDAKAGTVTIAHGPIKTMNWSAMTMTFKIKDKTLLDGLNAGSNVGFDFVKERNSYLITAIK